MFLLKLKWTFRTVVSMMCQFVGFLFCYVIFSISRPRWFFHVLNSAHARCLSGNVSEFTAYTLSPFGLIMAHFSLSLPFPVSQSRFNPQFLLARFRVCFHEGGLTCKRRREDSGKGDSHSGLKTSHEKRVFRCFGPWRIFWCLHLNESLKH